MNLTIIVKQDKNLQDVKSFALTYLNSIGENTAVIVDENTQLDHTENISAADIENYLSSNDYFILPRMF